MISTKDIKQYTQKVFSASQGRSEKKLMHPDRDWFLIVCTFFLMFSFSVVFSVVQYQQYQTLSERVAPLEETLLPQYNEQLVQYFVDEFTERMQVFEASLGLSAVVDDSTSESETDPIEDFFDFEVTEDLESEIATSTINEIDSTQSSEVDVDATVDEIIFVDN